MCSCCSPSSWHKIDKNLTIRPKIEVLRLPSGEHAKITHIIEGGIQLQAKFKHIRCNDYVSCNSLDENVQTDESTRKYPSRISCYSKAQRSAALATKSCDNIYSKQVRVTDPDLTQWTPLRWKDDSTRSAETLCNNNTNANLSTRSRLLAFFKKLSPRPKRSNRNKTRTISGQSLFLYDLENKTSNEEKSGFFESEHSLLFEKITRHKSFDQTTIVEISNPPEQMPTILIDYPEDEDIASPNEVISTECVPSVAASEGGSPGAVVGVLSPAQRPHSLHVSSGHLPLPLQTLTHAQAPGAMASSFESIGTCSLDAERTASDISDCAGSVSDRTLHSLALTTGAAQLGTRGPSTPEYVKRTARLFESPTTPTEETSTTPTNETPFANSTTNLAPANEQFLQVPGKKPSYLGLACSISGYSGITTYDSKLREGFRSREHSPCRIPVGKETSPMRPGGESPAMASTADINGNALLAPSPSSSLRVLNGHALENGHSVASAGSSPSSTTGSACSGNAVRVSTSVTHLNGSATRREVTSSSTTIVTSTKSFIQQRVERLYGPGALAQGFFRRTRQLDNGQPQRNGFSSSIESHSSSCSTATTTTPALPVLRHLRPEFAAQLSLGTSRNSTPAVSPREEQRPPRVEQQLSVESLTESLSDLQPAAPEVVLPLAPTPIPVPAAVKHQEKDGHYFLDLLKREISRINELVVVVEDELTAAVDGDVPLPEEALGKLRAASGQARLFVRQKLQQFEGLCQKNISQEPGEQFPTTNEDLAGFWDMVKLQIDQIDKLFSEIERHRKAGWTKESLEAADQVDASTSRTMPTQASMKRRQGGAAAPGGPVATSATTQAANSKAAAARKARDEARRKMMEERRRALKESQQTHHLANNSSVEIFVTVQENGK